MTATADSTTLEHGDQAPAAAPRRRTRSALRRRRTRSALRVGQALAIAWLVGIAALALLVPLLPAPDPTVSTGVFAGRPFGEFILGTDQLARDIFSRLAWGARTSMEIVVVTIGSALLVGTTLGLLAGYFRGKADTLIAGIADFVLAIPGLIMLLLLTATWGASVNTMMFGIVVLLTPTFTRLARANTIAWAERDFVKSAHVLGAPHRRVILRELLPNILPAMLTYSLIAAGYVMVIEGSLSFLGLGVPSPKPSWGNMIAEGKMRLRDAPHMVLVPSVFMFLTVLATNTLGNRRSQANARSRSSGTL